MPSKLLALIAMVVLAALPVAPGAAESQGSPPPPASSGSAGPQAAPTEATLVGVAEVVTGYGHSCARMANRTMRCWGDNSEGQLGQGDENPRPFAVTVKNVAGTGPLQNVVDIAAGDYHSCALLSSGQVRCFGYNSSGQLGDSSFTDRSLPVAVRNTLDTGNLGTVTQISAESLGTCALLQNDELRCWGEDESGQLGNGAPEADSDIPVKVAGDGGVGVLDDVRQVDAGEDRTCATLNNGQARCWGWGYAGALGNGDDANVNVPHPVVVMNVTGTGPLTGVSHVAQSGYHACARLANGQARCWGYGGNGELGNGGTGDSSLPVVVKGVSGAGALTGVAQISTGEAHTCARLNTGQARCWGQHDNGDLGIGPPANLAKLRPKPVINANGIGALTGVTQLATSSYHTCVRLNTGQARCWGDNDYKQLGNGNTNDRGVPTVVRS